MANCRLLYCRKIATLHEQQCLDIAKAIRKAAYCSANPYPIELLA